MPRKPLRPPGWPRRAGAACCRCPTRSPGRPAAAASPQAARSVASTRAIGGTVVGRIVYGRARVLWVAAPAVRSPAPRPGVPERPAHRGREPRVPLRHRHQRPGRHRGVRHRGWHRLVQRSDGLRRGLPRRPDLRLLARRPGRPDGQHVAGHQLLGRVAKELGPRPPGRAAPSRRALRRPATPGRAHPVRQAHPPGGQATWPSSTAASRCGRSASAAWSNLVALAHDVTPLAVPAPWHGMPVAPARLRWRVLRGDDRRPAVARRGEPGPVPGRRRVPPDLRAGHAPEPPGKARSLPLLPGPRLGFGSLPDGDYRLQVEAADKHGNLSRSTFPFHVANHEPPPV